MSDSPASRSEVWKEIWERKAAHASSALHYINGYDLLDETAWHAMIGELSGLFDLHPHTRLAELGCGAGAFLASIKRLAPTANVAGIDYAPALVDLARQRVEGTFWVADVRHCPPLASAHYDVACSFGTTMYLDSETDVAAMLDEMRRITRPGGQLYVGEISDAAQRDLALRLRASTHAANQRVSAHNPDHLYLPKSFFTAYALRHGLALRICDHLSFAFGRTNPLAAYRYSVCMRLAPAVR